MQLVPLLQIGLNSVFIHRTNSRGDVEEIFTESDKKSTALELLQQPAKLKPAIKKEAFNIGCCVLV